MCQHLEDLNNSVNHHFLNEQYIKSQNRKQLIQSVRQTNGFHCKYEKYTDVILDSILQITFRKLLYVKFRCRVSEEYSWLSKNAIKIFLPSAIICVMLNLPHTFQTNIQYHQKQKWELSQISSQKIKQYYSSP